MISALLKELSGNWYNENVYFKFRIHKMPFWKRNLARLLFMTMALGLRFIKSIRDRLEIPNVEMSIMNPCHQHCSDCENLNSFYPNPVDFEAVRNELRTLRNKEYIQACGKCSGMLEESIIPGIQLDKGTL